MPTVPGSGLVVVETELVFGRLEAVLNRPAMAFNADQLLNLGSCRAPCGEIGQISIDDMTPDQQASCPQAMGFIVGFFCLKIRQFQVAPVM